MNDIAWWIGFIINIIIGSMLIYLTIRDRKNK